MRLYFLFLLLIILSFSLHGQDKLSQQLQKGIEFFEKGKHAKAERIFDKILEQEESFAFAYMWKGKCLQEFEEYEAAYLAFCTARDLIPDYVPFWMALGNLKFLLANTIIRKPELCGECGKYILPDTGGEPTASEYYRSALIDYLRAINLDAGCSAAYYAAALTHRALGDSDSACNYYDKSIELKHTSIENNLFEYCH